MSDALLDELLARPVGPQQQVSRAVEAEEYTSRVEVSGTSATVTVNAPEGENDEHTGHLYLEEEGLDPNDWEVVGFRKVKWGDPESPMESVTFSFKKVARPQAERINVDELIQVVERYSATPPPARPLVEDGHGVIIGIGDMQFGKIDGDGPAGTLERTLKVIDNLAHELDYYLPVRYNIGHIHVGWMGDHIEGFVSQGGANTWRTQLTLNEQIRLTRRVMTYAMERFAPLAPKLTMAAVPGNHGEAVRFNGNGITRYDDSHDTEALIAVSEAASLAPEKFGHVEFFVPDTDELIVVNEVAGTTLLQAHGHQWNPGKHFEYWKGQAFHHPLANQAHVLMAGHLHHEHIDTEGWRTYVGVPALESESTWWRHKKGIVGAPGAFLGVTKDGLMPVKMIVRD